MHISIRETTGEKLRLLTAGAGVPMNEKSKPLSCFNTFRRIVITQGESKKREANT